MSESFGRGESALFLQNPELAAAARRQRLAQGLLEQAVKPRNVGGHAGGLAQMGQALIAGYMSHREDERIYSSKRSGKRTWPCGRRIVRKNGGLGLPIARRPRRMNLTGFLGLLEFSRGRQRRSNSRAKG
jgi:hypothetical protein